MTQIHKYTKTQIQILLYCADLSSDILCRHLRFLCLALLGRSKRRPRGQTRSMMMMILIETMMMMMLIETMMMMMTLMLTMMMMMMFWWLMFDDWCFDWDEDVDNDDVASNHWREQNQCIAMSHCISQNQQDNNKRHCKTNLPKSNTLSVNLQKQIYTARRDLPIGSRPPLWSQVHPACPCTSQFHQPTCFQVRWEPVWLASHQ